MKDLSKEVDWEKAGKDAVAKTAKDKTKTADATKKRVTATKKARVLAKKRLTELVTKQNEMDLKLADMASQNVALTKELTDLWAALEACENKWYGEGFANTERGVEPVVKEARQLSFQEGWMAALDALGVPEDSPLRDPGQIPFPDSSSAVHTLRGLLRRRRRIV